MRQHTLNILTLALGLAVAPAFADTTPQQKLLDQVRLGEATQRDDLVRQSLYRLELIAPDDPDVIAARARYLLRQGDKAGAEKLLAKLKQGAPQTAATQQTQLNLYVASDEGRQKLQQARLLGTTGHTDDAIAAYQQLFNGTVPDGDLAVEYWSLVAKKPGREQEAIGKLQALNKRLPGNTALQSRLAQLLFDNKREAEGYAMLEQMARSNAGNQAASGMWLARIQRMPIGQQSVASLQRFLSIFNSGDDADSARELLASQQKQLSDPAFAARQKGLAEVDAGSGQQAIEPLKVALSKAANDANLIAALGEAYSQKDDRANAVAQLRKAIALDPNNASRSSWDSMLKRNLYWLSIKQGDDALKANNTALARQKYQLARQTDSSDSYAVLGLGDVAVAEKNDSAAEGFYRQALRMDSGNSNAVRGLANIYRRQSPERAEQFLATLNASQRRSIDDIERSLIDDRRSAQATELENQGQWLQAAEIQRQRLAADPESVWVTYRLAKDLASGGRISEANSLFQNFVARHPGQPDQIYAYGLYLSGTDRDDAALSHLNTLPRTQWNDNIKELAERLEFNRTMADANRLRENGHEPQAVALLKQQKPSTRIDLTLADWAQQRGDAQEAQSRYQSVLQREPDNIDARLGLAELYLAQTNPAAARAELAQLKPQGGLEAQSVGVQRRVANASAALGDKTQAGAIFDRIMTSARQQPPSMDSALALRDGARFQETQGQPQKALQTWRDAMVASGITKTRPQDNDTFTRLTRNDASDDWLKRGVRSDAADLYKQQDVNVTLDHDYWGSSGTPGYSDLKAQTTMLQVDAPLYDGRMFMRTDVVNMNAGSFHGGSFSDNWGTCASKTCVKNHTQRASGASIAAGWSNKTWAGDIGTTPMGFDVVDIVGGLSYSSDIGPFGYTVNAHRRPISSSVLSFGGQRDPNTGTTWGGVRATGGGLSMSYDRGEANGVWSSLSADSLTGRNVEDNWRVRWMTGYYYKVINENNRRLTVGVTNMLWHYNRDLSGYSLGQGGYYSPQKYVSFALPVVWRQRTENWSWEVGGSVSWSHSQTDNERRFPISHLVPNDDSYKDRDHIEQGSSSNGFGYTARVLVERRITSNWSIGAGVDIQEAKDYTPSHGLIFVRYSQAGWQGDMNMPPQPLVPYADW